MTSIVRRKMAAGFRPNSPAKTSNYSIRFDNSKFETLVIGDHNIVNDNCSGNSTPSQESSPIRDDGKSSVTKGKRVNTTLNNLPRDNKEDIVSGKRDNQLQRSRNGFHPIWSKLEVVHKMFLIVCIRVRQWQF